MGLKGVCALIQSLAPNSVTNNHINLYTKKIIAIDTGILLYRFKDDVVYNFAKICIKYLSCNIRPVFIFDGPSPAYKQETIDKRTKRKQKIQQQILELETQGGNAKKIQQLRSKLIYVTCANRTDVYDFLISAGFDVFKSPGEAETMCAFLQHKGIVDYVYTDDSDAFALGCKNVLRNFKYGRFDQVNMDVVLTELDLTMTQFVDMCILCGCDYCPSIPCVNYNLAYSLILKHGDIEAVLAKNDFKIPKMYKSKVEDARNAFTNFSSFEIVSLKEKLVISENIRNFHLNKGVLHRLFILISKFNKL